MKTLLHESMQMLKDKILENLEIIITKQEQLDQTTNFPNTTQVKNKEIILNTIEELKNQNIELLDIQYKLASLVLKLPIIQKQETNQIYNTTDLFYQTISGKICFNDNHPEFNNTSFAKKLIEYYSRQEKYEECDLIISMLNSKV